VNLDDLGRLGLGCAPLGNLYRAVDDDIAAATVDAAWERGVRLFDTAPLYGHGLSEERLGAALAARPRDEYALATKVGRLLVPGAPPDSIFAATPPRVPVFDFSADGVRRSIDESLERLDLDRIDLLHVHDPEDHLDQAEDEAFPALLRLRDEGVIGAVGVGTNFAEVVARFVGRVDLDCVLLAGRCTLLDRTGPEVVFDACV
jgi:D-threo-aldose 1-dehydrogenase